MEEAQNMEKGEEEERAKIKLTSRLIDDLCDCFE